MSSKLQEAFGKAVEKTEGWLDSFITNLPNILVAIFVFSIVYIISVRLKKFINRSLQNRFEQPSVRNLIANISAIALIAVGIFLALSIMNLDKALTSVLAGAGVAGLAVGLALQGTLANTFSGIFLAVKDVMTIGDWVETNGYNGTVDEITLRYIRLREPDNNIVIIPNKMVVDNPFKNYGLTQQIRTTIKCGVGYEEDLERVKRIAINAIQADFPDLGEGEIEFHYLEFGDSSINFQLRFWVDAKSKLSILEARSTAIMIIKKHFDKNNINIPFPIRTLMMENEMSLSAN